MTEHALGLRGEAGSTVAIGHAGDVFDVKEPCHRVRRYSSATMLSAIHTTTSS